MNAQTEQTPGLKERDQIREKEPHLYGVVFYNDDFTTMEFVVSVLKLVFRKSDEEAQALMLTVHRAGSALVGTYTYDIAVTKKEKAIQMARSERYPLHIEVREM